MELKKTTTHFVLQLLSLFSKADFGYFIIAKRSFSTMKYNSMMFEYHKL